MFKIEYLVLIRSSDSEHAGGNRSGLLDSCNVRCIDKEWIKLVPQYLDAHNGWSVTGASWNSIVCHGESHLNGVYLSLGQHSSYCDQTSIKIHIEEIF